MLTFFVEEKKEKEKSKKGEKKKKKKKEKVKKFKKEKNIENYYRYMWAVLIRSHCHRLFFDGRFTRGDMEVEVGMGLRIDDEGW